MSIHANSCSAAGPSKPSPMSSAVFASSFCQFQQTKPPFSRNESIDFVQRFQWICSTISMDLFNNFNGFVSSFCRFCCPHPSFSLFVSGSLGCWILLNQLPKLESFIYWTQRHKDAELKEEWRVALSFSCVFPSVRSRSPPILGEGRRGGVIIFLFLGLTHTPPLPLPWDGRGVAALENM